MPEITIRAPVSAMFHQYRVCKLNLQLLEIREREADRPGEKKSHKKSTEVVSFC